MNKKLGFLAVLLIAALAAAQDKAAILRPPKGAS